MTISISTIIPSSHFTLFKMKFVAGLIALAALASAAPGKAPTPLDIKLESAGNAEIKAVITNTGKGNLKIFKSGTILDSSAVEKVTITSGGTLYQPASLTH